LVAYSFGERMESEKLIFMSSSPTCCPVCRELGPRHFQRIQDKDYWRCEDCRVTFLGSSHWPSIQDERAQYRLHENNSDSLGYRRFLEKLSAPLIEQLEDGLSGLDYGCGPGPALASMMRDAGHTMTDFDPCFVDVPDALTHMYDFITCTETAEHFHYPAREFDRLDRLLKPGGWLAVMTTFQTDDALFENWHYRRDPTHVAFYCEQTFNKIATQRGWACAFPVKDVALMQKPLDFDWS
jgi:ribosomal protein L37AE/L43A